MRCGDLAAGFLGPVVPPRMCESLLLGQKAKSSEVLFQLCPWLSRWPVSNHFTRVKPVAKCQIPGLLNTSAMGSFKRGKMSPYEFLPTWLSLLFSFFPSVVYLRGKHCSGSSVKVILMDRTILKNCWAAFTKVKHIYTLWISMYTQQKYVHIAPKDVTRMLVAALFKKNFYWSIVDLQCCVNFCCTARWFSNTYRYILFHILFHYSLSQGIEYSSLCYTVGPCCLSILYIILCIC